MVQTFVSISSFRLEDTPSLYIVLFRNHNQPIELNKEAAIATTDLKLCELLPIGSKPGPRHSHNQEFIYTTYENI